MKSMFQVVSQSEPVSITTQNGETKKSTLVLKEIGGMYEDSFVASIIGQQVTLSPNDVVWAALRFKAREYNNTNYMDCTVQEIIKM